MWKKIALVIMGLALAGGLSACSSRHGIPAGGPHYASWSHLQYSYRGGEQPRLTKAELEKAKKEGWWGTPIAYTIDDLE